MDMADLYGLPPERFIPERTALTQALRGEGRREEAERVTKLRKPSVAAWAVNQLVRTQSRAVAGLFEAGDDLLEAHRAVLSGEGDGQALRGAVERERAAVDGLLGAARGLLTSRGHELSSATLDRVAETLHAAALDGAARERVAGGCLERELRHVGIGPLGGEPRESRAARARAPRSRSGGHGGGAGARDRGEGVREARAGEAQARQRAQRASRGVELAERRRNRARQHREKVERMLAEADVDLRTADEALAAARAESRAAEAAHEAARRELARF
jgi:hypothetical protein